MKTSNLLGILGTALLAAAIGLGQSAWAYDKTAALYGFNTQSGGYRPTGTLEEDSAGNLYGATLLGGSGNDSQCCGVIFQLSPNSNGGYTYTVIHVFSGEENNPAGSLVMDAAGNLYGTAVVGGEGGEIFELSPSGSGVWDETILYSQSSDFLLGPVVIDSGGNLWGVVYASSPYVFELSPSGASWTLTTIFDNFTDGESPNGVTLDSAGNLYGTSYDGGGTNNCITRGCGTVFELTKGPQGWTESVIHRFDGSDGAGPAAALAIDASGNLYGSTSAGGQYGFGVIFELTHSASGWEPHRVHDFRGYPADGALPNSPLIVSGGNIYGVTLSGGPGTAGEGCTASLNGNVILGCGTAFEFVPTGNDWKGSLLYSFSGPRSAGNFPSGGLTLNTGGGLFGLTSGGGDNGGLAYELFPSPKIR